MGIPHVHVVEGCHPHKFNLFFFQKKKQQQQQKMFKASAEKNAPYIPPNGKTFDIIYTGLLPDGKDDDGNPKVRKENAPKLFSGIALTSAEITMTKRKPKNAPPPPYDPTVESVEAFKRSIVLKCFISINTWVYGGIYRVPGVTWSRYLDPKRGESLLSFDAPVLQELRGATVASYLKDAPFETYALMPEDMRTLETYNDEGDNKVFFVKLFSRKDNTWIKDQPMNSLYGQIVKFKPEKECFIVEPKERPKSIILANGKDKSLQVGCVQCFGEGEASTKRILLYTRLYKETLEQFQLFEDENTFDWPDLGKVLLDHICGTLVCTLNRKKTGALDLSDELNDNYGVVKVHSYLEVDLATTVKRAGFRISLEHVKMIFANRKFCKPILKKFNVTWVNAINLLTYNATQAEKLMAHPNVMFYVVCNHEFMMPDVREKAAALTSAELYQCVINSAEAPMQFYAEKPDGSMGQELDTPIVAVYALVDPSKYAEGEVVPHILNVFSAKRVEPTQTVRPPTAASAAVVQASSSSSSSSSAGPSKRARHETDQPVAELSPEQFMLELQQQQQQQETAPVSIPVSPTTNVEDSTEEKKPKKKKSKEPKESAQ